jgi:hypothetical protein
MVRHQIADHEHFGMRDGEIRLTSTRPARSLRAASERPASADSGGQITVRAAMNAPPRITPVVDGLDGGVQPHLDAELLQPPVRAASGSSWNPARMRGPRRAGPRAASGSM